MTPYFFFLRNRHGLFIRMQKVSVSRARQQMKLYFSEKATNYNFANITGDFKKDKIFLQRKLSFYTNILGFHSKEDYFINSQEFMDKKTFNFARTKVTWRLTLYYFEFNNEQWLCLPNNCRSWLQNQVTLRKKKHIMTHPMANVLFCF